MKSQDNPAPARTVGAQQVKQLRELTGAGWMDCKAALEEAEGDVEQAVTLLRKKGMAAAQKKAGRTTSEGVVGSYIHAGDKIGVLVEVNCESDFVARTPEFRQLVHDLAMHICAADPRFIRREEVTAEMLAREREIYQAQARAAGKPERVVETMVAGKLEKFYEETCLYEQHFIKDDKMTIRELIDGVIAKVGENISVQQFARFKVGENASTAESSAGQGEGHE
ncbi:MAG: translation elongation factor Ts [Terriglobia bacterium]